MTEEQFNRGVEIKSQLSELEQHQKDVINVLFMISDPEINITDENDRFLELKDFLLPGKSFYEFLTAYQQNKNLLVLQLKEEFYNL